MRVLISQPKGKDNLVLAFRREGAIIQDWDYEYLNHDLIIPTVDEELTTFSRLRYQLPVMVASPHTIDTCRDKAEFYRFCRRNSFLTPFTMQQNVIAKPRFGKGSRGLIRLDKSYIVQEDLSEFPEVSIDYFADWEEKTLSMIARYRKKVVNGESQEAEFIPDFNYQEVERLGRTLNLVGHNVIQGFLTKKGFIFTEVNCRFGGGSHLTFDKFNSPKWLIENTRCKSLS